MNSTVKYCLVTKDNYAAFYSLTQQQVQGPMLLPIHWLDCLWGVLAYSENEELLGGWVGRKRLSGWKARLYQEIVFDSMPQIFTENNETLFHQIIDEALLQGKQEGVAAFVVTHWSRTKFEYSDPCFIKETNATFINNLQIDDFMASFEHSQRKQIHKAERMELRFITYNNVEEAISMLPIFQQIRKETQKRAINNNENSTMLLKSEKYYEQIIRQYNGVLSAVLTQENKVAAMTLCVVNGKTMYAYYSGSDATMNKEAGASSYMQLRLLELARLLGLIYYDMGGAPVNPTPDHPAYGVYKFKRSYGGKYQEYNCGTFILNHVKYYILSKLKQHRKLLRIISKSM